MKKVETTIWEAYSKKMIPVKVLRKVFSVEHPTFSFFAHRYLNSEGKELFSRRQWTVSERLTRMAICQKRDSMKKAIEDAKDILSNISSERMRNAVNSSLFLQRRKELCLK